MLQLASMWLSRMCDGRGEWGLNDWVSYFDGMDQDLRD